MRKVIISLPPDLEDHVKSIDGRKLPGMIIDALREQWLKEEVEMVIQGPPHLIEHIVLGHHKRHHDPPVYGSIPAPRGDDGAPSREDASVYGTADSVDVELSDNG